MLAEILVRDTDGSSEAEQVISKGLIQAQKVREDLLSNTNVPEYAISRPAS